MHDISDAKNRELTSLQIDSSIDGSRKKLAITDSSRHMTISICGYFPTCTISVYYLYFHLYALVLGFHRRCCRFNAPHNTRDIIETRFPCR